MRPPRQERKSGILGRNMPHSVEAERYLLSACFIDGRDVVSRCLAERLTEQCFFVPANRIVYKTILGLYVSGGPIDLAVVAEELKKSDTLKEVGGFAYLSEISSALPTTAQAPYFIAKLKDLYLFREVIRISTAAQEKGFEGNGEALAILSEIEGACHGLRTGLSIEKRLKPITDFDLPPDNDPSVLLGDRYFCRGHAAMLVSNSGMGKSSLVYQASVCWALGRPFMGIQPKGKLKSLHIQSEDEDGDIGESWASIQHKMNLSREEVEEVKKRLIIKTDKVGRGESFLRELQILCTRYQPDIVFINPLHAFLDGDIKDAEVVGKFCREGLAGVNREDKWGYFIVHHTPKPAVGKEKSAREWNEVMYEAAGSADLINWARTILVLKPTATQGQFNLHLAKRGNRAGVVEQAHDSNGNPTWVPVTKIPMQHCREKFTPKGRNSPMSVIFWEPRAPDVEDEGDTPKKKRAREESSVRLAAGAADCLACYASHSTPWDEATSVQDAVDAMTREYGTQGKRIHANLTANNAVETNNGRTRRTKQGDAILKTRREEMEEINR